MCTHAWNEPALSVSDRLCGLAQLRAPALTRIERGVHAHVVKAWVAKVSLRVKDCGRPSRRPLPTTHACTDAQGAGVRCFGTTSTCSLLRSPTSCAVCVAKRIGRVPTKRARIVA